MERSYAGNHGRVSKDATGYGGNPYAGAGARAGAFKRGSVTGWVKLWGRIRESCGLTIAEFRRLTLAELYSLSDAAELRERTADWRTARIVAMLVAVNSRDGRYDPVRWMSENHRAGFEREQREAAAERAAEAPAIEPVPLTGDQVLAAFLGSGLTIIDKRSHAS
jgi:hypothetical protein